jgi:hypothetical protein
MRSPRSQTTRPGPSYADGRSRQAVCGGGVATVGYTAGCSGRLASIPLVIGSMPHPPGALQRSLSGSRLPESVAVCCKAVRSSTRVIWDTTRHQPDGGEHHRCAPFIGAYPPYLAGHGDSHAARPCRRRNAAARSRPHCRQRHRSALRSIGRLSGVSGCPLPQWLGISSRRILRRSILGKWTTAVLLVQITPPLPIAMVCTALQRFAPARATVRTERRTAVLRIAPCLTGGGLPIGSW